MKKSKKTLSNPVSLWLRTDFYRPFKKLCEEKLLSSPSRQINLYMKQALEKDATNV